jgi:molecular chaperone GrpE
MNIMLIQFSKNQILMERIELVSDEKLSEETAEDGAVFTADKKGVDNGLETKQDDQEVDNEISLERQLEIAKEEAANNLDSSLRAQAELANARKRFDKQRALAYTNANADVVSKLLPVLDDFDRAIENVPLAIQEDSWYVGIEMVQKKILKILENLNVVVIEAIGEPFDPNYHEALGQEPTDDFESGTVSRVMQKGYQIGEKVVRPSLVYVAD